MHEPATRTFRDLLAPRLRAGGWLVDGACVTALSGGRTNRLWRVSRPEGDIVTKLFADGVSNPLFPNDPADEVKILRHLAPQGIAPRLLDQFQTGAGHCLIYTYITGQGWSCDPASAANLLHRVHRLAPPNGLRATPDGSAALKRQVVTILSACPADPATELRRMEPAQSLPPGPRACLPHGDPVPANIIGKNGNITLIDWQCPASGDPCENLAVFLSPAMHLAYRGDILDAKDSAVFLEAYPDPAIRTRYQQLAPWYHWRMAAYCLWLDARGDRRAAVGLAAKCAALRTLADGSGPPYAAVSQQQ